MKAIARSVLAAVAVVLLAVGVWDSHGGAARAQGEPRPTDVKIVNGRSEPIPTQATGVTPITGSVTLTNDARTPIAVREQGPVTVTGMIGVHPGANGVIVANPPDQPVATCVVCPPVQKDIQIVVDINLKVANLWTVPLGKRLVIEYVSSRVAGPSVDPPSVAIRTTVNGQAVEHETDPSWGGFGSAGYVYRGGHATRLYADGGTPVDVVIRRSTTGHPISVAQVKVSGHLVDM